MPSAGLTSAWISGEAVAAMTNSNGDLKTMRKETEAEVLRLFHAEGWRRNTIARQLGLHHSAVGRVLARNGVLPEASRQRASKADKYIPFMKQTLAKYPKLTATRLHQMVKVRGFTGGIDHFRDIVAGLRPKRKGEAYLRLTTMPGEQAQCDWAHFGKLKVGNAERRLLAFVMVLSWSRKIFLRFYFGDSTANFLRGHVEAFEHYQSVPREVLYDNLKSAVLERVGDAIHFNPDLLALAAHYRFAPKPVGVRRANEKGRVERAISYIRTNFFAGREFTDIDDLNRQAIAWCQDEAVSRKQPPDRLQTVAEALEKERSSLLPLPATPFPVYERKPVQAGKTPYVRFDLNDYSIPHEHASDKLIVEATLERVYITNGHELIATHSRVFGKGETVENKEHEKDLVGFKKKAKKGRAMDRIRNVVPSSEAYYMHAAERGHNLGRLTQLLTRLLDLYGAVEMEAAIAETIESGVFHSATIQHILERNRRSRGLAPPVALQFSQRKLAELTVIPGSLEQYDNLAREEK
jgi:transposase